MRYDSDRRRAKNVFTSVLICISVLIFISGLNLFLTLQLLNAANANKNSDKASSYTIQVAGDDRVEYFEIEIFGNSAPSFISSGESDSN